MPTATNNQESAINQLTSLGASFARQGVLDFTVSSNQIVFNMLGNAATTVRRRIRSMKRGRRAWKAKATAPAGAATATTTAPTRRRGRPRKQAAKSESIAA